MKTKKKEKYNFLNYQRRLEEIKMVEREEVEKVRAKV